MVNKEKNFVSAVIYVHNSEKQIDNFLKTVVSVLEENFEKSEIICVNDFSDDGSVTQIKKISDSVKKAAISILNMSHFHGTEIAMNAGVDLSIGDFVFEFDSTNMDFDKSEIMKVYKKSLEGFDIVSASPSKAKRTSSSIFYYAFNKFSNLNYKMTTERFRILSRRVINRISSMNKTVPYRKALYANCGLKAAHIFYEPAEKIFEKHDALTKKYRKALAVDAFVIFTDAGYKIALAITSFMLAFALAAGIYSLVFWLLKNPVSGWASTILFLSVSMFFLFTILTIILKYLQILVNLVFKRTKYSFESIEKI